MTNFGILEREVQVIPEKVFQKLNRGRRQYADLDKEMVKCTLCNYRFVHLNKSH